MPLADTIVVCIAFRRTVHSASIWVEIMLCQNKYLRSHIRDNFVRCLILLIFGIICWLELLDCHRNCEQWTAVPCSYSAMMLQARWMLQNHWTVDVFYSKFSQVCLTNISNIIWHLTKVTTNIDVKYTGINYEHAIDWYFTEVVTSGLST